MQDPFNEEPLEAYSDYDTGLELFDEYEEEALDAFSEVDEEEENGLFGEVGEQLTRPGAFPEFSSEYNAFDQELHDEGIEAERGGIDWGRAIRRNLFYAKRLRWGRHRDDIRRLLRRFWETTMSPEMDLARAVARWQKNYGLKVDGIIGRKTWGRMRYAIGRPPAGWLGRAVRRNRHYSRRLGWWEHRKRIAKILTESFEEPISGETDFARLVAQWQREVDLIPDGIIGPRAWSLLKLEPALEQIGFVEKPAPSRPRRTVPLPPSPTAKPPMPFPNIHQKLPNEYRNALKAHNEYREVERFFRIYWKLTQAAREASLGLDRQGNIEIRPRTESFLKLLTSATANKIKDEVIGKATKFAFGERAAKRLGVLGAFLALFEIRDRVQREKLVNEQRGTMRERAFKKKLSFFMDVMAADLAKQKPRKSPTQIKNWLVHQYQRFVPLFRDWRKYVGLEDSLAPGYQPYKTIGPAP